jgi:hypothetical protein
MRHILVAVMVVSLAVLCVAVVGALYWHLMTLADAQFQHLLADWRDAVP